MGIMSQNWKISIALLFTFFFFTSKPPRARVSDAVDPDESAGAKLERALIAMMLDIHTRSREPFSVRMIMNRYRE